VLWLMSDSLSLDRIAGLSADDLAEVRALSAAVYPPEVAASWEGRLLEWARPEWSVRVRNDRGELVSYIGAVVRDGLCNDMLVRMGGIGGVMTHPASRGRGHATRGIARAIEFFRQQKALEFALLVCEPRLMAWYGSLGWREFAGETLVRQHGKAAEFTFNRVMTYAVRSAGPGEGVIDLCGPPW
jgi:aminoglycoside 2'-N-acetyltransferase I